MNPLLRSAFRSPTLESLRLGEGVGPTLEAGSGVEGSVPTARGIYHRGNLILVVSGAIREISGLEVGLIKLQIVLRRNEVLMEKCCLVIRPVYLASCSKTLWYPEAALQ